MNGIVGGDRYVLESCIVIHLFTGKSFSSATEDYLDIDSLLGGAGADGDLQGTKPFVSSRSCWVSNNALLALHVERRSPSRREGQRHLVHVIHEMGREPAILGASLRERSLQAINQPCVEFSYCS